MVYYLGSQVSPRLRDNWRKQTKCCSIRVKETPWVICLNGKIGKGQVNGKKRKWNRVGRRPKE